MKKRTPLSEGYRELSEEKVSYGKVYFRTMFETRTTTECYRLGKLLMMPHSKIALHSHDVGCEWYLDEDTGETYFCPQGSTHEFVNNTNSEKHLLFVQKEVL